jgi:sporulation protein YlmC with PRC-barrel domain
MQISLEELPGRVVLDSAGRLLGKITSLQIDTESWAVQSLRLRLRRRVAHDVGARWSLFHLPTMDVPTGLVLAASDAVILRAGLEELGSLVNEQAHALASPQLGTS